MTSGSLLAKPIEGTVSVYTTTKNRTPGFIKGPVELFEGVVGSGLHMSGIEGGVRWFFRPKGLQPFSSDIEAGENSHKRRRIESSSRTSTSGRGPEMSPLTGTSGSEANGHGFLTIDGDRRLSMSTEDSLPAYDDARSPAYTEDTTTARASPTTPMAAPWSERFIISTSGLSIAMSEESLRSLKYCLSWLRWANAHIGRVIGDLKNAVDQLEQRRGEDGAAADRAALGARIMALRGDVLKTLQDVIETVSTYAGGALPENARALVKRHLTSLPQRFRLATHNSKVVCGAGPSLSTKQEQTDASTEEGKWQEAREGAQRVLVLAKEGLDMMAQVSGVVDVTIVSAEEWCARLGKRRLAGRLAEENEAREKKHPEQEQEQPQNGPSPGIGDFREDVEMG